MNKLEKDLAVAMELQTQLITANLTLQTKLMDCQEQNNNFKDQVRDLQIEIEKIRRLSSTSKKIIF